MQDLASNFFLNFPEVIPPDPHNRRGTTPFRTQHPAGPLGDKRPRVETQTLVPLNFSAVVAPLRSVDDIYSSMPSA